MPDGSCRTCGGELVKCSLCVECRKVVQKICKICKFTTERELHHECLNLEEYQSRDTKSASVLVTGPRKIHSPESGHNLKNYLPKLLLIFCIVGIFAVGIIDFAYFYFAQYPIDNEQNSKLNTVAGNFSIISFGPKVLSNNIMGVNYNNCLGSANGSYLLIKCPTPYGFVYQAIVQIPTDLITQFQSNVFSIRDFSVNENAYSIIINYQNKMYSTSFILH